MNFENSKRKIDFQGLGWGQCAISTARWKGLRHSFRNFRAKKPESAVLKKTKKRVADLLEAHGIDFKNAKENGYIHLQAEGLDKGPDGVGTGSSIPLVRALRSRFCQIFEL